MEADLFQGHGRRAARHSPMLFSQTNHCLSLCVRFSNEKEIYMCTVNACFLKCGIGEGGWRINIPYHGPVLNQGLPLANENDRQRYLKSSAQCMVWLLRQISDRNAKHTHKKNLCSHMSIFQGFDI